MTDKRNTARAKARQWKTLANDEALQKAKAARILAANAVEMARAILSDSSFTDILRSQGIKDAPRSLVTTARSPYATTFSPEPCKEKFDEETLDFIIAWTFFFPLFANPTIAAHLETTRPGFTCGLKDAFIALVVGGAFHVNRPASR
jgi:hypothetical protein